MSFRAVLWALKQDLAATEKLILVALASHASKIDGSCFPKIRTIACEASVSVRTIHRHLPILEKKSLVRIERKFRGKARLPHKYWLACPNEELDSRRRHSGAASDTRTYDSRGRPENHYLNHNLAQQAVGMKAAMSQITNHCRTQLTPSQVAEQEVQHELVRRLGKDGWQILMAFTEEVPKLCAKLQRGTLTSAQLLDLKARYIENGGST